MAALDKWCRRTGLLVVEGGHYFEDGVWSSIDGLVRMNTILEPTAVVECKFRFGKIDDIENTPRWHRYMRQAKGYCKVTGTKQVWMVFMGVTTRPPSAVTGIKVVDFTEQEIEENWTSIVHTRKYLDGLIEMREQA